MQVHIENNPSSNQFRRRRKAPPIDVMMLATVQTIPKLGEVKAKLLLGKFKSEKYIWCVCCDISEKNRLILFIDIWYSNQVPCVTNECKIVFGSKTNLSNYGSIYHKFYVFVDISWKKES